MTTEQRVQAQITLLADLEAKHDQPPVPTPVIPPERMVDFQRKWRRSPAMRWLIRCAGELSEAQVARSKPVRGLWEMAQSAHWRDEDGRGLCCDFPDMYRLNGLEVDPDDVVPQS